MAFGAPVLSMARQQAAPRWLQNAREQRANELAIAQLQIDARPNRTPSAALLGRLGLGGGGGGGATDQPALPNLPNLPNQPELPSLAGGADSRIPVGRSGPTTLVNNAPPARRKISSGNLSEFLRQNSRVR